MAGDIREVLRENAKLRGEIQQARDGHRTSEQWTSEAERIKREVARLADLHDLAQRPARRESPRPVAAQNENPALSKMMMLMMLADMS